MSLISSLPPSILISCIQFQKNKSLISENLGIKSVKSSVSASVHKSSQTDHKFRRYASSDSSTDQDSFPLTRIFVKGLPQSISERSLRKAFAHIGEVSRVKIVTDKRSGQPVGFAYVWFSSEDSAQLAVKEMNGQFVDGRFIYVTIARPGSCKTRVKPYKF
ncbi:RNA recognition motif domain [Dillenia turbinata]|uniref:RNA recognition motif domain n=1 Tax=Dillenia turbinata TaxID=194707 RepID=A0AAN8YVF7_9MAGN